MSPSAITSARYTLFLTTGVPPKTALKSIIKSVSNSVMDMPYSLKYKDSAVGGRFSTAQLIANKSGKSVKGFYNTEIYFNSKSKEIKPKTKIFHPQSFVSSIISTLGNKICCNLFINKLISKNLAVKS